MCLSVCVMRQCLISHLLWLMCVRVLVCVCVISSPQCSVSCGTGVHRRELRCGERDPRGGYVEFPIRRCRNLPKPPAELQQPCSSRPCRQPHPPPHRPPPHRSPSPPP